jgi:hypothetical protein
MTIERSTAHQAICLGTSSADVHLWSFSRFFMCGRMTTVEVVTDLLRTISN